MPHPHILTVPIDCSSGEHFVIGDVHGSRALCELIENLSPNDHLFIVGDLIDRAFTQKDGYTSAMVLNTLISLKNNIEGPRVYAVKGNHETFFLEILSILRQGKIVRNIPSNKELFLLFIQNGGGWIFKKDSPEKTKQYHIAFIHYNQKTDYKIKALTVIHQFIDTLLSSDNPSDYLIDEIDSYERYISDLPYVIQLKYEDNTYQWIAHADLPLSDETLCQRIEANEGFSEEELIHITKARPRAYETNTQRNETSSIVYCGHNIISDPLRKKNHPILPVRAATSHINLDVGAFLMKSFIMLNIRTGKTIISGENLNQEDTDFLHWIAEQISSYYNERLILQEPSSFRP